MTLFESYMNTRKPSAVNDAMTGLYKIATPLTESEAVPGMMAWGRGYGEEPVSDEPSALDLMNMSMMMNDPYTGGRNLVLSRVNDFDLRNADRYTEDMEPELDEYTQTLFIDDMGPEAYTINGENPYRALERIQKGDKDVVVAKTASNTQELPEVAEDDNKAAMDMFAQMFETIPTLKG